MLINGKICEDPRFENLSLDEKCCMCQYTKSFCGNYYTTKLDVENVVVFVLFGIITAVWIYLIYLGLTVGVGPTAVYIRNFLGL